jgi:hypothetical protein
VLKETGRIILRCPKRCPELLVIKRADQAGCVPRAVSDAIKENPVKWKDVDGAYFGALLDEKLQPANMGFYADIIRKDAAKRNNARIYQQIADLHLEPIPTEELDARVNLLTPGLRSLDGNARKIDGTKGTDLKTYLSRAEEETPYLIEGLLYQGVAHQFMGTIKAGKTTFLLLAVRSILHGEEFLGRVCEPTNILYVTEQPGASFRTQLRDAGVYCDDNLKTYTSLTSKTSVSWTGLLVCGSFGKPLAQTTAAS